MNENTSSGAAGFIVWIDADACPREVRDLVLQSAARRGYDLVFVANTPMRLPPHPNIRFLLVPHGSDQADNRIVEQAGGGDLVVTGDIPLAARLAEKSIHVLNPRGEELTTANIGERLAMRNLMEELRSAGLPTGGPKEYGPNDRQRFANALDRALTKRLPRKPG